MVAKEKVKLASGLCNSILEHYGGFSIDSMYQKNSSTNWEWKFSYIVGWGSGENYYWYTSGSIVPIVQFLGAIDGFMIRDSELPIGLKDQTNEPKLEVYPNPANDLIYIEGYNNIESNYTIIDNVGRIIQSGQTALNSISLKEISAGTYILVLYDNKNRASHKFKICKLDQ